MLLSLGREIPITPIEIRLCVANNTVLLPAPATSGVQNGPVSVYVADSLTLAEKAGAEKGTRAVKFWMRSVRTELLAKGCHAKT